MSEKIHVYVAGAFTSPNPDQVERNIAAAEDVAARIIESTDQVVCVVPHSLGRKFAGGPGSPQYWYDATLSLLKRCDALILAPNWQASSGSKNEVAWCRKHEVPVFNSVAELLQAIPLLRVRNRTQQLVTALNGVGVGGIQ